MRLVGPGERSSQVDETRPSLLEGAQDPVEVAHVDALARHQLRQLLQELVPVGGSVAQEQEDGRLAETLQPGPDLPAAGADAAAAAGASRDVPAAPHRPFRRLTV